MYSLGTLLRTQMKNDELKRNLLANLEKENESFSDVASAFYAQDPHDVDSCLDAVKAMLSSMDNVLNVGDIDSSLFLRNVVKPLRKIKQDAAELKQNLLEQKGVIDEDILEREITDTQTKLYVSLYQSEGHDLQKWAAQLSSIESYMMGRPIYQNEEDVQRIIRMKLGQVSEAYAVIAVNKQAIVKDNFGRGRKDRLGNEVVNVEMKTVAPDNIIEFVHTGKRYHFYKHKLIVKK